MPKWELGTESPDFKSGTKPLGYAASHITLRNAQRVKQKSNFLGKMDYPIWTHKIDNVYLDGGDNNIRQHNKRKTHHIEQ